jgi:hypothetical protein
MGIAVGVKSMAAHILIESLLIIRQRDEIKPRPPDEGLDASRTR